MAKKSEMNTMRRKVIADAAPQKKAESQADSQLDALNSIDYRLNDIQATDELIADSVEAKGNQITSAVDDVAAGVELTAEFTEKTTDELSKLNDTSLLLSDKLSKLAELLQVKVDSQPELSKPSTGTGLQVIQDTLPEPEQPEPVQELFDKLLPPMPNNSPDADFFPEAVPEKKPEDDEKNRKQEEKNSQKFFDNKFGDLSKIVKGGFSKSISLTDKISSMLFSYTVSALANMVKQAAMVMGVIMLIDLIKVHFNYWSKLFDESFTKFSAAAEKWGPTLTAIKEMSNAVVDAFVKGDWGGLAVAIGKGLVDVLDNLGEMLMLGMSKLLAGVLRAVGLEDSADKVEGAALDRFQYRTGAQLSEEDQLKRAKYVDSQEREQDQQTPFARKVSAQWKKFTGQIDDDEYDRLVSGESVQGDYANKSEDERLKIIMARQEAQAELKRTQAYVENTKPTDETRMKSATEAVKSTEESYTELTRLSPEAAKDLKDDIDSLKRMLEAKTEQQTNPESPQPSKSDAEQEAKQAENIKKLADYKDIQVRQNQGQDSGSNVTVNTAVNKNNTTVMRMPPQTSSAAPGMANYMRSN